MSHHIDMQFQLMIQKNEFVEPNRKQRRGVQSKTIQSVPSSFHNTQETETGNPKRALLQRVYFGRLSQTHET